MNSFKFLALVLLTVVGTQSYAQTLNCDGSRTGAKLTFLSQSGSTIRIQVDWDEGAGFSGKEGLVIINGYCKVCPHVGSLDQSHRVSQAVYEIEQENMNEPVTISWGPTSVRYCGTNSITVGGSAPSAQSYSSSASYTAPSANNFLGAGEALVSNDMLISANGAYMLRMQGEDGNLCIYTVINGQQGDFVWCSGRYGFSGAWLSMQDDGNLVVYDGNNNPQWATNTMSYFDPKWGQAGYKPAKLVLSDDGRLKLLNAQGREVWVNQ